MVSISTTQSLASSNVSPLSKAAESKARRKARCNDEFFGRGDGGGDGYWAEEEEAMC